MNARSYEALRKLSRGRFTLSNFTQLKALAKNTGWNSKRLSPGSDEYPSGALLPVGLQGG